MRKQKPQPKPRNTFGKRLRTLATPQERIKAMLDESKPGKRIRRDANLLVGKWQAALALIGLDKGQDKAAHEETEQCISDVRRASLDALAVAFGRWDAEFFEHVAHAMRQAKSSKPYGWKLNADLSLITGEKASSVAKRLTEQSPITAGKERPDFESMKRQILRYLREVRRVTNSQTKA